MNKTNLDAKNNHSLLNEYLMEEKILANEEIILGEKQSNSNWLYSTINANGNLSKIFFSLVVEQKKNKSKYGLKLISKIVNEPFIRFDSEGPTHRNSDKHIPLEKQYVSTPHFQKFNEYGKSIAYKSEVLNTESEAMQIQKDINFGFSHFCHEANCISNDEFHSEIKYKSGCEPQPTLFDFMDKNTADINNIQF